MTRDDQIVKDYSEGKGVQTLKETYSLSHEGIRRILIARGVSLRKPGPIPVKTKKSFGRLTTKERLINQVKIIPDAATGDHWVWLKGNRYGRFVIKGRILYAHRAAFYIVKGRIPAGRLRKNCSINNCIHPNHWKEKGQI